MATKSTTPGVQANDTSLAVNWGLDPGPFLQKIGGVLLKWLEKGIANLKDLFKKSVQGAQALVQSIKDGSFPKLLSSWFQDDPGAVVAGGLALLAIGGVAVTSIGAGIAAAVKLAFGSVVGGAILTALVPKVVQGANVIYTFNFAKTDAEIEKELKSAMTGLYAVAGESLGRSMAGLLLGKNIERAKLTINMRATATLWLILEEENKSEIHEEMLNALATLGIAMYRYGLRVLFAKAYMYGRQWARKNIRTGIPWIDKWIANWGLKEGQSLSIQKGVNTLVEKVEDQDKNLGAFFENFLEGFGEGFGEFIQLDYSR